MEAGEGEEDCEADEDEAGLEVEATEAEILTAFCATDGRSNLGRCGGDGEKGEGDDGWNGA